MKPPRKLQTDMGKEFYNSHVKRVLNRYRGSSFFHRSTTESSNCGMFQQNSERDDKTVNGLQKKFRLHKRAV